MKEITFLLYPEDRICVTVPSSSQVQICSLSYARSISPALLYAYVCGCIWVSDVYLLPEVGVGAPDFTGMPGVHLQSPTILNPYLYILLKKHLPTLKAVVKQSTLTCISACAKQWTFTHNLPCKSNNWLPEPTTHWNKGNTHWCMWEAKVSLKVFIKTF